VTSSKSDLEMARRHIATGEKVIDRQRALIADLESAGSDAADARALLTTFVEAQWLHVEHLERLENRLGLSNT